MLYCRLVRRLVPIVDLLGLGQQMYMPSMEEEVLVGLRVVPS